ncbi:hypothetical protein ACFLR2_01055 [Chlamydiota bacterium]
MSSGASRSATEGMGSSPSPAELQKSSNKLPILVALGIIVALGGVFLVLASYQILPTGVNTISNLGIWGQVLGFGPLGLGLLITLVSCVKGCQAQKKSPAIPVPVAPKSLPTQTRTQGRGSLPSRPAQEAYTLEEIRLSVQQEIGIDSLDVSLAEKNGRARPDLEPRLLLGESRENAVRRFKLYFLKDEKLLGLPLQQICTYSRLERGIIYTRLSLIDQGVDIAAPAQPSPDPSSWTLAELRAAKGDTIPLRAIPEKCLCMLTTAQLEVLLADTTIDRATLSLLLPPYGSEGGEYTYSRLKTLKPSCLEPHLRKMTCEQFCLLPIDYFTLQVFPWEIVIATPENLQRVLALQGGMSSWLDRSPGDFTQAILNSVGIEVIQKLAPHLSPEYLPLLEAHLKSQDFPWSTFIQKKGIGAALHRFKSSFLVSTHFPWAEIIDKPEELEDLFSLHGSMGSADKDLLHLLNFDIIKIVLPRLSLKHLPLVSEAHLKHKDFPWSAFIHREGIGKALHRFQSKFLVQTSIPWDVFADKPEEIRDLFETQGTKAGEQEWSHVFTENIFSALTFPTIRRLAPALTVKHLPMFSADQLRHPDFPWTIFIQKEGIGATLHGFKSQFLVQTSIPWEVFADKPKEIGHLFKTESTRMGDEEWDYEFTRNIFSALTFSTIAQLAPALTVRHIPLFSQPQLQNPGFPWSEFFRNEQVAREMSKQTLSLIPLEKLKGLRASGALTDAHVTLLPVAQAQDLPRVHAGAVGGSADVQRVESVNINDTVKITLNSFLGRSGPVDKLPIYPGVPELDAPLWAAMTAPIMRGLLSENRPFIAVKLRRLSDRDEVIREREIVETEQRYYDFTKTEQVVVLYQSHPDGPLYWGGDGKYCWQQQKEKGYEVQPIFFTWNFTAPQNGEATDGSKTGSDLLRQLIEKGAGEDIHGVRWEIVRDL